MLDNKEKLKLSDLIDLKFLQELQDAFAKAIGISSFTVDEDGPITNPSNFTDFCANFIRPNKLGAQRCEECDIRGQKLALEKGGPIIHTCHAGLVQFAIPIMIAGKHIASIMGGQVSSETLDEKNFKNIAKELGITNKNEYKEAWKKIRIMSEDKIKDSIHLFSIFANSISEMANKNYELIKKNKRENLLKTIIDKIRSSLDIDETLTFICEETMKLFNVQRASISRLIDSNDYAPTIKKECVSNAEIAGMDKLKHFNEITKYHIQQLIQNKKIFTIDNILESDTPDYFKEGYNLLGVKSLLVIPIKNEDDKWGILILAEYNSYRHWTEEEIEFAQSIASQIYIAIKHSELYKKERETKQKEIILRDIIGKIRSSLDIKQIQHEIVSQIGKFFNADGVRIADYDYNLEDYVISKDSEYRSSDKLKSWVGVNFKSISGFTEYIRDVHTRGEDIIFSNLEKHLDKHNLRGTKVEDFYREFGFTSSAAINIYHGNVYLGDFVITFEHPRDFSDDEIQFLKILADQAGTAFYQSKLLEKEKEKTERETFLRKTTEIIRTSLDKNTIKHLLVTNIGKHFSADRVFFSDFDPKNNRYPPIDKNSEYLSNVEKKSFVGYDWSDDSMIEYIQPLLEKKELNIFCWDEYVKESSNGQDFISRFEDANVKSSYNFPIFYQEEIIGFLCIEFTQHICKKLSDEDISTIRHLCTQSGIALYHSALYAKAKSSLGQTGMKYM